jgi:3-isopropylmalate/(R)-2-methylmalate dehydratase small subunit
VSSKAPPVQLEGRVWKFGDDINSDLLYPQVAYGLPLDEACKLVFRANRPGWADLVEPGDLIVGGRNFGMGSSRTASALLIRLGIAACIADTVTSLFFRNCVNTGLPVLSCPGVTGAVEEGQRLRIDFSTGLVDNLDTGAEVEGRRLPAELLHIIESGGVLHSLEARGLIAPA